MKKKEKIKRQARERRHKRVRSKIFGSAKIPRLSLFRSNKAVFIQLIDDEKGITILSAGSKEVKTGANKTEAAKELGKLLAKKALEKNIKKVVFDRGGYKFHGRVKAVAEGIKDGGLNL